MTWWGNSLERAVGFSSYATIALKNAQKKIDKVLDIPAVDDNNENVSSVGLETVPHETISEIDKIEEEKGWNPNEIELKNESVENEFSDIDLKSPANNTKKINRFGDWKVDESLTVSQIEGFHTKVPNVTDFLLTTPMESLENESKCSSSENVINTAENSFTMSTSEASQEFSEPFCTRNSHLSMSSDCTVKKVCEEMESSGNTEDGVSTRETASFQIAPSETSKVDEDEVDNRCVEILQIYPEHHKDDKESCTTSSDIELISNGNASCNGDNALHMQTPNVLKHQRSTSGSSMSICKIDNGEDISDSLNFGHFDSFQLHQQYNELSKKIEVRESKLLQLNRENFDLRETINNLTRQIEQMNEHQDTGLTDISTLTREFTTRLNEAERRAQVAVKERDQFKTIVNELKNTETQKIEKVIKDKEEQVSNLLMEGEKLAQDMLKANNTIKKLRANLKEKETEMANLNLKNTKAESDVLHLKKVLDNKEDNERKHVEGISQLTKAVEKLEKENNQLKALNETLQERYQYLDGSMKQSTTELTQVKRQLIESETEMARFKTENDVLKSVQSNETHKITDFETQLELKNDEIMSYQKKLSLQTKEFSYKEEEYNSRISYLQEKLAEMQQRNDEINEAISQATKPIVKQLDSLQSACSAHTANWEQMEINLNQKLRDLQQKLAISEESVSSYKDELQNQEDLIVSMREEKSRLMKQYKQEYNSRQTLLDEKLSLETQLTELNNVYQEESQKLLSATKQLEVKVKSLNHQLELEKQNNYDLNSRLKNVQYLMTQQEKVHQRNVSNGSSVITEIDPDDSISLQSQMSIDKAAANVHGGSVYESLRQPQGLAVVTENLQSSLKQRDGQIAKLQSDMRSMSKIRQNLLDEITGLQQKIEALESELVDRDKEEIEYKALCKRYDALLQMYGEKMDECAELKLDLSEIKDVYRSHIDMLSKKTTDNL